MEEISLVKNKFGWRENNRYTILDLGTMPNAIVIKQKEQGYLWLISLRGYFSFPDSYYKLRFETKNEAIEHACKYMIIWIEELNNHLLKK